MKRSPIDWLPDTPYNTKGILGGMIIPRAPADTITAVANFLSYPSATIAGINIPPIAATVAGPEPEIAAKNMLVRIAAIANPPVYLPTNTLATSNNRDEIPHFTIISP